jgi:hypothetical protein
MNAGFKQLLSAHVPIAIAAVFIIVANGRSSRLIPFLSVFLLRLSSSFAECVRYGSQSALSAVSGCWPNAALLVVRRRLTCFARRAVPSFDRIPMLRLHLSRLLLSSAAAPSSTDAAAVVRDWFPCRLTFFFSCFLS